MATYDPAIDADYAEHLQSYRSFVRGVRWAIAAIALLLILMAYFLL
jgi:hypothetical protein